jgi:hypothetical protein
MARRRRTFDYERDIGQVIRRQRAIRSADLGAVAYFSDFKLAGHP